MRIITANVNGVRSAAKKGFFTWASRQRADVICLQETKAQEWQLEDPMFHPKSYHCFYHDAEKKGYSGTALFAKAAPDRIIKGMGVDWIDIEGRYLEARFGKLSVVSLYLPSGTSGDIRQDYKYRMMDEFLPHLKKLKAGNRSVVVCGDWNIAHTEADIRNWRGNRKNSIRQARIHRCIQTIATKRTRIHVVVAARTGERQKRRLANRLPDYQRQPGIVCVKNKSVPGQVFLRPCASDH